MTPAATIVIALKRQRDEWLEQCVQSALHQTAPSETIVVHSAGTPASNLEILNRISRECPRLRVIVEEKRGSFPGALNLGIRLARADRIGLLNSDDWLEPAAAAECLALDADIISTGNTVYHADGITIQPDAGTLPTLDGYRTRPTLEAKAAYLQPFFLLRREAVLAAGGLDETIGNYPGIDDYDLIWTLLERGATVGIVEKPLYNYRDHEGERLTLESSTQAARNLEKILRKHGIAESDIPAMVRRAARWYGQPIHRALAAESV